ncbi:MAG: hypothetical protein QM715_17795 [Nibricoccus sp.]
MKKLLSLAALGLFAITAQAATFTFTPNDGQGDLDDLGDLDHYYAYSWGISGSSVESLRTSLISGGQQIQSAKLTIWNVWDWTVEPDVLNINLLDDPTKNVVAYWDNQSGGNYFAPQGGFLTSWSDPKGGDTSDKTFDFVYNFTTSNIGLLTSYIIDSTSYNKAVFGLGFDPDCHYYNTGVQLDIVTTPKQVPEGAFTVSLLGLSLLSLAGMRRFIRR